MGQITESQQRDLIIQELRGIRRAIESNTHATSVQTSVLQAIGLGLQELNNTASAYMALQLNYAAAYDDPSVLDGIDWPPGSTADADVDDDPGDGSTGEAIIREAQQEQVGMGLYADPNGDITVGGLRASLDPPVDPGDAAEQTGRTLGNIIRAAQEHGRL